MCESNSLNSKNEKLYSTEKSFYFNTCDWLLVSVNSFMYDIPILTVSLNYLSIPLSVCLYLSIPLSVCIYLSDIL